MKSRDKKELHVQLESDRISLLQRSLQVKKPDGLTVVRPEDVREFIFPLNVSIIPGIGEKTTESLKLMGITKVEELVNCDIQILSERFGKEMRGRR
jgi:nucleotidyltransferase/DNA polymerase involved in DNA repair